MYPLGDSMTSPLIGRRFLMLKRREVNAAPMEFVVVENWFEELERLAPHPEAN